ncbi:hypothetical protein [Metabacillus sp. Hm71]|uniref:hypothetical protein n=1 Tax=Metabacillus sp. Hm71 TaxID=3450743 RepID=UPI003F426F15
MKMNYRVVLLSLLVILAIVSAGIEYFISGFQKDDASSLLINLVTEFLSVLMTVIVIEKLIEKQKTKQEIEHMKKIIGNQYDLFLNGIIRRYIQFITKNPANMTFKKEETVKYLTETINKMDKYIDEEFSIKGVNQMILNPADIFNPIRNTVPYQKFCEEDFKKWISIQINEFTIKYISLLPQEVSSAIFTIENRLRDDTLATFYQHGQNVQMKFSSKEHADRYVQEVRQSLKEIGQSLLILTNYLPEKAEVK